jgi:HD-GYP domain-containing protein (c-di-GMP phosphodiesterase class II)
MSDYLFQRLNRTFSDLEVPLFQRSLAFNILVDLRKKSPKTADHCLRVAFKSINLAGYIGAPAREIFCSALTHDAGKLLMPNYLLNKKCSEWTEEDAEKMKEHPIMGYYLLKNFNSLMARTALFHHKKVRGYPIGYEFRNHSLAGRIINLVSYLDVYDALTTRSIKIENESELRPMTPNEAREFLADKVEHTGMEEILE